MKETRHRNRTQTKIKTGTAFVIFIGLVGIFAAFYFLSVSKSWGKRVITNADEKVNQANINQGLKGVSDKNTNQIVPDTNSTLPFKVYTNNLYGFTLELEADSTVTEEEIEGITTIDFGQNNRLAIMSPEMEGVVRESAPPLSEEEIILNEDINAKLIIGSSAKDGSEVTYILFTKKNYLYEFVGNADFLDRVTNTLNFK